MSDKTISSTADMTVIRDSDGNVINIGDWDYRMTISDDGNKIALNPLPDGASSATESVNTYSDGSRAVSATS